MLYLENKEYVLGIICFGEFVTERNISVTLWFTEQWSLLPLCFYMKTKSFHVLLRKLSSADNLTENVSYR
jgi:hypothetical protein